MGHRLNKRSRRARLLVALAVGFVILSGCTQNQPDNLAVDSACSNAATAILDFRLAYASLDVSEEAVAVIRDSGADLADGPLRDSFQSLEASMKLSENELQPSQIFAFRRDAADLAGLCLESVSAARVEDIGSSFLTAIG